MSPEDLRKRLKELGLGGHEPAVYATLLEGPVGAAVIARKCGLSRSSVYTTLNALTGKGLVGTTHRDEVKQFVAEGPGALLDLLKREEAQAQGRVKLGQALGEQLERLGASTSGVPQVTHFEGQQGLKRIYLAMVREAPQGASMCILRDEFIWQPEWSFIFEEEWRARVRRFKAEKRVSTRLLINPSKQEREQAAWYRARPQLERRYLARPVTAFGLYLVGDTAAVLSIERHNLLGIRIANRHLAANFRMLFEGLWQSGRPAR